MEIQIGINMPQGGREHRVIQDIRACVILKNCSLRVAVIYKATFVFFRCADMYLAAIYCKVERLEQTICPTK